jgi:hypothetical protein
MKKENTHGGKRENSGRKKKEPTITKRIPVRLKEQFEQVIMGNAYVKMKKQSS